MVCGRLFEDHRTGAEARIGLRTAPRRWGWGAASGRVSLLNAMPISIDQFGLDGAEKGVWLCGLWAPIRRSSI